MENKNTIIAIVLMLAVWAGFTVLFPPAPSPTAPVADTQPVQEPSATTDSQMATPAPAASRPLPAAGPLAEREIVVENGAFRAVLTNAGGRLKTLELKDFSVTAADNAAPVAIVPAADHRLATLATVGLEGFALPSDTLYDLATEEKAIIIGSGETREVVFSHRLPSGSTVEKIYVFRGDGHYDFDLQVRLINESDSVQRGKLRLTLVHPWEGAEESKQFEFVGPVTYSGGELQQDDIDDLAEKPPIYGKEAVWTGFSTKYFLGAAVPLAGAAEKIRIEKTGAAIENQLDTPEISLAPGEAADFRYFLYYGPKDLELLKAADHQLAEAVDFGFFAPIAKPLLMVLKFFYKFLGNYGLAIILLTVIIKLLFWPLTQKSYSSMKSMQKLQPEMQKIREKFGKDRERLNKELMDLYKNNRVNPLGGCLPMIVQIPVFFALYKVLMDAIELRHAPFYFWITDLSAKDPYYITPLIMGASMFVQQKMTPTTMDPTQAKIFMLMPIIFTFMFLNFPSGLVIYWLVNNLLTIGQQAWINRKS